MGYEGLCTTARLGDSVNSTHVNSTHLNSTRVNITHVNRLPRESPDAAVDVLERVCRMEGGVAWDIQVGVARLNRSAVREDVMMASLREDVKMATL